jgi:hypothetical protein
MKFSIKKYIAYLRKKFSNENLPPKNTFSLKGFLSSIKKKLPKEFLYQKKTSLLFKKKIFNEIPCQKEISPVKKIY